MGKTSRIRQFLIPVLVIGSIFLVARCHHRQKTMISRNGTLEILAVRGAISDSLFIEFERKYNVSVSLHEVSIGRDLARSLETGREYDLILVDEEHLLKLAAKGLLEEIDVSDYVDSEDFQSVFMSKSYADCRKYGVPYLFTTIGVAYRKDKMVELPSSWRDLFEPEIIKGYIEPVVFFDKKRELLGTVLIYLGYSPNTEDPAEIEKAAELLISCAPNVLCLSADLKPLIEGVAIAGTAYGSDVARMSRACPELLFFIPEEGTLGICEFLVVPRRRSGEQGAYKLLQYLLRPDIAGEASNASGYATTLLPALSYVDRALINSSAYYLPEGADLQQLTYEPGREKLYDHAAKRVLEAVNASPAL